MTDAGLVQFGVTGTDTGIGKTIVACALAARARQLGLRVAAMKPVESGIVDRIITDGGPVSDAERLRIAAGEDDALSLVRPYGLEEALAPMVAARRAGVEIDLAVLDDARATLCDARQLLLVEGAGGLLVPLTPACSMLDLYARWHCELIIVAGNRLGVLNHVLLTVRAAEAANLPVRAVILTQFSSRDAGIAEATNFDALVTMLPRHTILRFPWVDRTDDMAALAAAAEGGGLDVLLTDAVPGPSDDTATLSPV